MKLTLGNHSLHNQQKILDYWYLLSHAPRIDSSLFIINKFLRSIPVAFIPPEQNQIPTKSSHVIFINNLFNWEEYGCLVFYWCLTRYVHTKMFSVRKNSIEGFQCNYIKNYVTLCMLKYQGCLGNLIPSSDRIS